MSNQSSSPSRRFLLVGLTAALLLPRAARAAPTLTNQTDIAHIQDYLNGIHTMVSRFDQVAENGAVATGTIYLERPGHMRIVYDLPHRILIVATGGGVYYYDAKLDQVTSVNLDETPAWFLLQPHVRLGGDIRVENLRRSPGALRLTVTETEHPERGSITLVFTEQPLQLRQWTVIDAQDKSVTVTLVNPEFGIAINSQQFIWHFPGPSRRGPRHSPLQ